MLVVAVPLQRTRLRHRPPQVSQTLAAKAPQATPLAHVAGQVKVPPQPSPMVPQYCCTPLVSLQVVFTHPVPPRHTLPLSGHAQPLPAAEQSVPQLSEPPQPSPTVPQYWPPAAGLQVIFEQLVPPTHMLLLPHPQPLPDAEQSVPQLSELPQPSPTIPQYWPPAAGLQATGVHIPVGPLHKPSWHCHPVFVQVVPQCAVDPHPSPISPQY
jgi:hypothetical protein